MLLLKKLVLKKIVANNLSLVLYFLNIDSLVLMLLMLLHFYLLKFMLYSKLNNHNDF